MSEDSEKQACEARIRDLEELQAALVNRLSSCTNELTELREKVKSAV